MDAILHPKVIRHFLGQLDDVAVVRLVHWGESWAKSFVVGALQGAVAREAHDVDVVLHQHDVSYFVVGVEASGGVGYDEVGHSEQFHHANGHAAFPQGVTLVVVETPLHANGGEAR